MQAQPERVTLYARVHRDVLAALKAAAAARNISLAELVRGILNRWKAEDAENER